MTKYKVSSWFNIYSVCYNVESIVFRVEHMNIVLLSYNTARCVCVCAWRCKDDDYISHASSGWFIILMVIIAILLLILIIACIIYRSRGDMYPGQRLSIVVYVGWTMLRPVLTCSRKRQLCIRKQAILLPFSATKSPVSGYKGVQQ